MARSRTITRSTQVGRAQRQVASAGTTITNSATPSAPPGSASKPASTVHGESVTDSASSGTATTSRTRLIRCR